MKKIHIVLDSWYLYFPVQEDSHYTHTVEVPEAMKNRIDSAFKEIVEVQEILTKLMEDADVRTSTSFES